MSTVAAQTVVERPFTIGLAAAADDPRCTSTHHQWGTSEADLRDWLYQVATGCNFTAVTEQPLTLDGARWGIADLIVHTGRADLLVECKQTLDGSGLRTALGQTLAYRACGYRHAYVVARRLDVPDLALAVAAHRFDIAAVTGRELARLIVSEHYEPGFIDRDWNYRREMAAAWIAEDYHADMADPAARLVHRAMFPIPSVTPKPEAKASRDVYNKTRRSV